MAVQNCDELSNIIAVAITSWDEDLAQSIAQLSIKKNDALKRSRALREEDDVDAITGWTAHELELKAASADIELRAIVQAKILSWDIKWIEAQLELARQIKKMWGSIAWWVDLLNKLNNSSPLDYGEIARLWWWETWNATNAVIEIKRAIAEFTASNYSIRAYSDFTNDWVAELKKLLKNKEITPEEYTKRIEGLHKEVMEKIAKWENPAWFVKLDKEWQTIKKVYWDNPERAWKAWSQFVMARELLSDWWLDDDLLAAFEKLWAEELTWPLTMDQIMKCDSLEELLTRAYTNTEQLYKDWFLREAYREKLSRLASWMRLTEENAKKVKSLINTMQFAEEWETFSNIVMKNKVYLSAKKIGLDVSKTDGTKLYNGLRSFAESLSKNEKLLDEPIKIAWVDMTPADVIQLCYEITWDQNIIKLLETWTWGDWILMSIATQKLLWMDRLATQNIIKLFKKGLEAPKVTNIRDLSLLAITWINVRDWAKVGFFDSRKWLYYTDKLSKTKADFMDKLAEKNKMRIDNSSITTISSTVVDADTLAETLKKEVWWWYLIVNDIKWRDNTVLREAVWKLTWDDAIEVLVPRGGMLANFSMEDWKLYYKTINDDLFDDVAWAISIQSMWQARPTREMLWTAYEVATGKNGDKIRYQASYSKWAVDNLGRAISDQQDEYFKNSVIRDANWNLIMMRHWTDAEFDAFDFWYINSWNEWPWFYTSADRYKPNDYWSRVIECYVNITNPISLEDYKIPYKVFYDIADDWLQQWRLTKEAYDDLVAYVKRNQEYSKSDYITSSLVGFLWEYTHRVNWGHPNLVGKDVNRVSEFMAKRHWYKWFFSEFNVKTWFDWIVNHRWDDIYTAVAFFPRQMKYVDNKLPTGDWDMRYMRDIVDSERYNTITKLRDAIKWGVSYDGKSINELKKEAQAHNISWAVIDFLEEVQDSWSIEKAKQTLKELREADAIYGLSEEQIKRRWDSINALDMSKIVIKEPITDPKEIALAIFDYSIWSLDKSEIWKMVGQNWRINKKLFGKLTKDEQIEVANRVLTYWHLYDVRSAIRKIEKKWIDISLDELSNKLDSAWRRLIKDYYLNPNITVKLSEDISLSDFIQRYTDNWFLLHEAWILADADGKVLWATVWTWVNNYTWVLFSGGNWKTNLKYYHNHPSWGMPSNADMANTYGSWISTLWWILPSWVTVEFSDIAWLKKIWSANNGEKMRWAYKWKPRYARKMKWGSRLEEWIAFFYEASRQLWVIDNQNWGAYDDIIKAQWWAPVTQEFLDKISDRALEEFRKLEADMVDFLTPEWSTEMRWMRQLENYASQADMSIDAAMKVQMFTKDRTWEQIANAYWIPYRIVEWDMIEGVKAWGARWNWMFYFTEMVKEWTCPHELYHAVFDMVAPEKYQKIINDAMELFDYTEDMANEVLADSFAHWFNTWEFKYWTDVQTNMSNKRKKSFLKRVVDFFKDDVMGWLWLVDAHKAEVEQLFKDIASCAYLPDANQAVSSSAAMIKYNKELNDTAVKYFGEMLWQSSEVVDEEYIKRVQTALSEKLGMDIKTFDAIDNKSELWQKIDKQFTIDRLTAWKYDKTLQNINEIKVGIENLSEDELATEMKKDLGDLLLEDRLTWNSNIELIREAYLDYKTAASVVDSLAAKGRIISLTNWVNPQTLTLNEIQSMFKNKTFSDVYKSLFFGWQEVDEKQMASFITAINNELFDGLSIGFAENLVKAWYSLPLINVKNLVYDFLTDNIDLNSAFVQAFFFKNDIPLTQDNVNTIIKTLMPDSFKFDYETSLFKWRFNIDEPAWLSTVFSEVDNRFLPESYSALAAISDAKAWNLVTNREKEVLEWILDKYIDEVKKWMSDGSLTFKKAQELKQEAAYALDMFEQDYLMPRYWIFLTPQQKQSLMWMKYSLPIGVAWQNINTIEAELVATRTRLLENYSSIIWSTAMNNDINMAVLKGYNKATTPKQMQEIIEKRREQLINAWWVIREVNGQFLVFNAKDALAQTLENIPENIQWLGWLKTLWRKWIDEMSNKQAYTLLRYIEAAKWLAANANFAMELMYKQNPQLMQYLFFSTYRVEDWLPRLMKWNWLAWEEFFKDFSNTAIVDKNIKIEIFGNIISTFRKDWFITNTQLKEFIQKAIDRQIDEIQTLKLTPADKKTAKEIMENMYTNSFIPYTYLRDIPDWWRSLGATFPNIKEKVKQVMKQQYTQAMKDLEAAWIATSDDFFENVTVRLNDWSVVSMKDLLDMDIDTWKKNIFNDENILVKPADELKTFEYDPNWPKEKKVEVAKEEKEYRDRIINDYDATIQSMLSQNQIITEAERDAMTAFMRDVRTDLRKYSLTSKLVDSLDALSWLNEEASRWIKNYLIWFLSTISFWQWKPNQIIERYKLVKDAYKWYYGMTLGQLARMKPTSQADELAINLAKYFKNLERLLGSADGITWVTTDAAVNRAFYHIWEVFMNLDDSSVKWVKGIFWLLSAIEQNQVLKLFKYSMPWQASYVPQFTRKLRDGSNFMEWLGWYRDYVEEISWITRDQFNKMFGAWFTDDQFKRIIQGLCWFTLTSDWWWRVWPKILDVLNGSNFIFRFLMSYPWQLFTIPQQWVAYFLKQAWHEKELWVEDLAEIDEIRETYWWILDWAYNELRLSRKTSYSPDDIDPDSFYNRYWIPDVGAVYKDSGITTTDDIVNMYAKIDGKYSKTKQRMAELIKQFDPYKDNANNFIDWVFCRNFKNIAFLKWLKQNDFMQFGSAKAYKNFMDDPEISSEVKAKLLDRVAAYSGRNFRNMLWLGFWWLDRIVWASGWANIFYWMMQLFNFRWAWWQNIFKQSWAQIWNTLRRLWNNVWLSKAAKDEVAKAIATSPEWLNFTQALLNDLKWTRKLQRFQDNGRRIDEEEDGLYGFLDFLEFFKDTMNMTSQWYQWLQSFWPFRPFNEMAGSALASAMNPTIYKDTYWIWAFMNAWHKNFWRQWKPANWMAKAVNAYISDWASWLWAYFGNEFWNLSFGSLRYMINEDMNGYWYTYEVTWQEWWIPSIIMWESQFGSDKNFMYELDNWETWETIKEARNPDNAWSERKVYHWNYFKSILNASQLFSFFKNVFAWRNTSYFTPWDLAGTIQKTPAWRELYLKWYVTPRDKLEAETFFKTILNHSEFRPWSTSFNKSIMQFDDTWHMDWKKWHKADAEMELWLEHMKYLTDWHWEFIKVNGWKQVDPQWEALMANVRSHYWNKGYVANTIYQYSKNWLDNHSTDPNYQLYIKMLWQWQAHMLIETKIDERVKALNVWLSKEDKWSEDEYKQSHLRELYFEIWNSVLPWDSMTFFDRLNRLDQDDAILAGIQIIQDQSTDEDKRVLERFFTTEIDEDWVENVSIKSQYKKVLTQIWNMARAMDEWNPERLAAEMSSLAHMFKNSDPTWAVTASMMNSIVNRIYDSDRLSSKQKEELIVALFHDNKEFVQKNPEKLRELLWDNYDEYADLMNQMLYQWDWQMLSILEDITTSWQKSSWWWANLSNLFKKWSLDLWWSWGSSYWEPWRKSGYSYGEWVPVKIKWSELVDQLWLKWYSPMNVKYEVIWYKPHSDFSLSKDINRSVKWPKTQQIQKKKQLSKLETDTAKALEAES